MKFGAPLNYGQRIDWSDVVSKANKRRAIAKEDGVDILNVHEILRPNRSCNWSAVAGAAYRDQHYCLFVEATL